MDNICLYGYFQSEKYFKDYKDEVKNLFNFDFETKEKITKKLDSIEKVGIHIRLGDYLHKRHDSKFFITLITHLILKKQCRILTVTTTLLFFQMILKLLKKR